MKETRTFQEHKKWYISEVTNQLHSSVGGRMQDAAKAVKEYELSEKIDRCHDIALHDDPRSIAADIEKIITANR